MIIADNVYFVTVNFLTFQKNVIVSIIYLYRGHKNVILLLQLNL